MDFSFIYKLLDIYSLPVILLLPVALAFLLLILSKIPFLGGMLRDFVSTAGNLLLAFFIFFSKGNLKEVVFEFHKLNPFSLNFASNNLSWLFAVIISVGGFLIILASLKNVRDRGYATSFHFFINLSIFGMLLAVYTSDLIGFFIGIEIMTWASFLIINLSRDRAKSSSIYYVLFNVLSAYLILMAILLIYSESKSMLFSEIQRDFALHRLSGFTHYASLILFSLGIITKIGVMPLHIWLPNAYNDAPDSYTPFLSALISKVGVYAFIVFISMFYGQDILKLMLGKVLGSSTIGYIIAWLGVITSIVATFKAIVQEDIKKLLAYSSIAQLGYVITALGVGTNTAIAGAIYHTVNHAIMNALLFITIAGIIHRTGKSKFHQLGRLIYKMPLSFMAVLMGIIGLAGMPPLSGFASKWMIYTSLVETKWIILLMGTIVASTGAFIYCYKLIYGIFLGQPTSVKPDSVKEIHFVYWIPMLILMGLLVLFGMFPGLLLNPINDILGLMRLPLIDVQSSQVLSTGIGGFNGFTVMMTFGTAFVIVFLLFSLFSLKTKKHNTHRLDIAYAGETPTEDTPLHYGYGMGKELHRIPWVGRILKRSATRFFAVVGQHIESASEFIRGIYTGDGQKAIISAIILTSILSITFVRIPSQIVNIVKWVIVALLLTILVILFLIKRIKRKDR